MPTPNRRSVIATVAVAVLVTGTLLAGGVLGQAGTDGSGADAPTQDTTFLRVAHVSPDAPEVDVSVDGDRLRG